MSTVEWGFLLAAGIAFWWRLDRLGKQLEAVSRLVIHEMAELLGNEERLQELVEEWRQDQAEAKRATRQFLITWGIIGAAVLGWLWLRSTG
jgi:hypothetical protein